MASDPSIPFFYVRNRGRVSGPFSRADLTRMIRRGILARSQEVSADRGDWRPAGEINELFGGSTPLAELLGDDGAPIGVATPAPSRHAAAFSAAANAGERRLFYRQADQTFGPMPVPLLESLAMNGKLSPDAIVWEAAGAQSYPASQHPLLANITWPDDEDLDDDEPAPRPFIKIAAAACVALVIAAAVSVLAFRHNDASARVTSESPKITPPATVASEPHALVSASGKIPSEPSLPPPRQEPAGAAVTLAPAVTLPPATLPTPPVASTAPATLTTFVTGVRDDTALAQAVGFVIIGGTVTTVRQETYELPVQMGSCFAVSPDGYLLTNNHVIEQDTKTRDSVVKADGIYTPRTWVYFGKSKFIATVVFASGKNDLAVLKIDRAQPFFRLGRGGGPARSAEVVALGFPGVAMEPLSEEEFRRKRESRGDRHADVGEYFNERDFDFTLTRGVVSRIVPDKDGTRWIQHEAVVRHGNSGGPLVNAEGIAVGVNTRLQMNEQNDVQTNNSFEISQFRALIDRYVTNAVWE